MGFEMLVHSLIFDKISTNSYFPRWYRQLLLWPGPSHEAPPDTHDPQPTFELWPLQKDGNLQATQGHAGGNDKIPQRRLHPIPQVLSKVFWFPVLFQSSKPKILFPFRSIRPDNMGEYNKQMQRFNVGEDCPVFDGLYEFCQVWPITQFFLFPSCEKSFICLEGKSMIFFTKRKQNRI